jgi:hypothetical protein
MPYFDQNVGPFEQWTGRQGLGEIRMWTGNRSQVMWEPGVDFDDSRWHAIEFARLISRSSRCPAMSEGS